MDRRTEDLRLSDAQLREVIERAARLPARSEGVSLAELREIATELDIDPSALDLALEEVLSGGARVPTPRKTLGTLLQNTKARIRHALDRAGAAVARVLPRSGAVAIAAGTATGTLAGILSSGLRETIQAGTRTLTVMHGSTSFIDVPAAIALIALTIVNSMGRRASGEFGRYLRETIATFAAFTAMWSLTSGAGLTQDIVLFAASSVAALALWGRLVIPRSSHGNSQGMPAEDARRIARVGEPSNEKDVKRFDLSDLRLRPSHT